MRNHFVLLGNVKEEVAQLKIILDFIGQPAWLATRETLCDYVNRSGDVLGIAVSKNSFLSHFQEVIHEVERLFPDTPLVVIEKPSQANDSQDMFDRIEFPFNQEQLLQVIHRCQTYQKKSRDFPVQVAAREMAELIVGNSEPINKVRQLISQVAESDVNVLILGESGTGKEVIARCIHMLSHRHDGPWIPLNCGAIPSELLESELFGHEKGSFTGAITARKGRFELASGGTIFLDEIGDMPLNMQVKLLRVLQERCFERIGGSKPIQVDVRVIAATHRNLEKAIHQGTFREDLYYRLNVVPIEMPALRDHIEDLPMLISDIVNRMGKTLGCQLRFTAEAISILSKYSWPGNIRELSNLIERLMVLLPNGVVDVRDLPSKYRTDSENSELKIFELNHTKTLENKPNVHLPPASQAGVGSVNLKEHLMNTELYFIRQALETCDGVVARAANYLGMRRTTLVEKMRKYGISRCDLDVDASDDVIFT